ncbi:GAF domain-containing protein [Pelagerythrobacter rhizovicinus]|uniref:GAF domain-containing protein n=1 Tax=Pelagerythrobacter rhizovicinus TaxID=2268576 RepID=A0A4Q2KLZ2_9SPHN|nr:GAF domain-containing protein [Pelagerythrobacter rhizovicinus]RXZ66344.1 GAF domain-containing protein [Pelagerythrobacter rhizovicinus]
MAIALRDLAACFEGVIPSIVATAAPDGTPNISYLSHVVLVDDVHIALSNQFFSKTAANVRVNPNAAVLIVDPRDGTQYQLDTSYERSLDAGELFEEMAGQLRASSAQIGMAQVMRLRSADIYRVNGVHAIASPSPAVMAAPAKAVPLTTIAGIAQRVSEAADLGAVVDAILSGFDHAMLLLKEGERLVTIGTRGYERSGIGSEVAIGEGVIGTAAAEQRPVRVSDLSRIRRFGSAVEASSNEENRTRTIPLPGMAEAMSQIALPMVAQGKLKGVLFLESRDRLAFSKDDETAFALLAAQAAAILTLSEGEAAEAQTPSPSAAALPSAGGRPFRVVHYSYDDSVFIDNEYVIKGVAGRLLMYLLRTHLREGRTDFTNREIRLANELRLPEIKDNLETRLLLLRRRLEEKVAPIRLVRTGRGRIRLDLARPPSLEEATAD